MAGYWQGVHCSRLDLSEKHFDPCMAYSILWEQLQRELLKVRLAQLQPDIFIFQLVERDILEPASIFT